MRTFFHIQALLSTSRQLRTAVLTATFMVGLQGISDAQESVIEDRADAGLIQRDQPPAVSVSMDEVQKLIDPSLPVASNSQSTDAQSSGILLAANSEGSKEPEYADDQIVYLPVEVSQVDTPELNESGPEMVNRDLAVREELISEMIDAELPHVAEGGDPGYFPTDTEWETIGRDYPRADGDPAGGGEGGRRTQAISGLWPGQTREDNFYQRNSGTYETLDRYLGLLTPSDGIVYETPDLATYPSPGYVSLSTPFFTRAFNPERATFKLRPFYLDVLSVGGTLLYSDFNGDSNFAEGEEDGWLAAITTQLRLVAQLTPSTYFSVGANLYYLPISGKVGFDPASAFGIGAGARFAYETEAGPWWIGFSNNLTVLNLGTALFDDLAVDEIERAGRYRFGRVERIGRRTSDPFEPDNFVISNRATLTATRLLSPDWRLLLQAHRSDFWDLDGFDHLGERTALSAYANYDGQNWRFAPFAGYELSTEDFFDTVRHLAEAGIRGPITEQLRLFSSVGYTWTSPRETDSFLWTVGLAHDVGPYTRQSLSGGTVYTDDRLGDEFLGTYVRYSISQEFSRRILGTGFAQWADTENLNNGVKFETYTVGGGMQFLLSDYMNLGLGASYEEARSRNAFSADKERLILSAALNRTILPRLIGSLRYQYEDVNIGGGRGFQEHLYIFSITQQF